MTDPNRRINVTDAITRANEALRGAETLIQAGLHRDAVSRAYYAAFHGLRALLFARGLEARTHAGTLHLFNLEYLRPGLLPSSHNRLLAGLQRSREIADYDAAATFSGDDARAALDDAKTFVADAVGQLRKEGFAV